jgi:hypothetical protein
VKNVQKASGSLLTGVLEGVVWGLGSIVGANKSAQGSDGAIDFGFKRPSTNNLESAASSASSSDVKDDASMHERRDRRTSSEDAEFRCVRMDSKDASDYMSVNRNNNKPKPGDAMVDFTGGGSGKPVEESKVMVLSTDEDEDWDDWDDNGPNPETTAETTESAPTDGTTENVSQDDMVYTASVDTPNEDGMDDDGVAIIDKNEVPTEMSKMSNEVPTSSTTTCIRGHYFNVVQEPEVCEAEHDADPQPTTTTTVIVTEIATTATDPNGGGGDDDATGGSCHSPMVCVSKAITTTTTIAVDPKAEIVDAELAEKQMAGTTTTTTIVVDLVPASEISEDGSSGTNSTGNCSFMASSGVEVEVPSADALAPQAEATDAPVPASTPGPESVQSEDSVLVMNTEGPPSEPMRETVESLVIARPPDNAVSPAPVPTVEHTTATDKPNNKGQSKQSDDDVVLRTRTRGGAKKK